MQLRNIPPGHIARSKISPNLIVLVGKYHGIQLTGYSEGFSQEINGFNDDYEDLGKLNIELEEVKTVKVKASVE